MERREKKSWRYFRHSRIEGIKLLFSSFPPFLTTESNCRLENGFQVNGRFFRRFLWIFEYLVARETSHGIGKMFFHGFIVRSRIISRSTASRGTESSRPCWQCLKIYVTTRNNKEFLSSRQKLRFFSRKKKKKKWIRKPLSGGNTIYAIVFSFFPFFFHFTKQHRRDVQRESLLSSRISLAKKDRDIYKKKKKKTDEKNEKEREMKRKIGKKEK